MPYLTLSSPVGDLTLFEEDGALVAVEWGRTEGGDGSELLRRAEQQLTDYFAGRLKTFVLPLASAGSPFQKRVWNAMANIPYGTIRSYGDLAGELRTSPRSVGTACGRNPLPIIVPCHRVLGASGAIGGYSGGDGLPTKRWLLDLERRAG